MEDKYGFLAIADTIREKAVFGEDHRIEYVKARKDHYKAVVSLSDTVEELSDTVIDRELVNSDRLLIPLGYVAYTLQKYITTLASQAPIEDDTNTDPCTATATQFNNGIDEWEETVLINLESAMVAVNIPTNEPTYYGLEFFANAMLNADNPDVVISMYLNLVKYLEKFDLIKLNDINAYAVKFNRV